MLVKRMHLVVKFAVSSWLLLASCRAAVNTHSFTLASRHILDAASSALDADADTGADAPAAAGPVTECQYSADAVCTRGIHDCVLGSDLSFVFPEVSRS